MSTVHLHETTSATPEQLVAGLTDFGPGRSELFPRSADKYPSRIVMTTTDSNLWGGDSGHTYGAAKVPR